MFQTVKTQTLVGSKKQDYLIQHEDIRDVKKYKPIAVIGGTNYKVFQDVYFYHQLVVIGISSKRPIIAVGLYFFTSRISSC